MDILTITNKWWWGTSVSIIAQEKVLGHTGIVEVQFETSSPNIAYIRNLSVSSSFRNKGMGRFLIEAAERNVSIAGYQFCKLSANKEEKWLVEWYESMGYIITYIDEHEYQMTKVL